MVRDHEAGGPNPPAPTIRLVEVANFINRVKTMSYKVGIVIEKDEFGYYAYCPELEGCQSQGDSLEEVIANIREAIELYLETLSKEEIKESLSKEILTTSLEVQVA